MFEKSRTIIGSQTKDLVLLNQGQLGTQNKKQVFLNQGQLYT